MMLPSTLLFLQPQDHGSQECSQEWLRKLDAAVM